jgi:hypothetical protein
MRWVALTVHLLLLLYNDLLNDPLLGLGLVRFGDALEILYLRLSDLSFSRQFYHAHIVLCSGL